jgi:hypothetical protein
MARPSTIVANALASHKMAEEAVARARAPTIARLLRDRPDLTPEDAVDHYRWACERLRPSDPPYADIITLIDETFPRPTEGGRADSLQPGAGPHVLGPMPTARRRAGSRLIVSEQEVLEKREELRTLGHPHGQKALASALHVSQGTIRRRLGRL